jgi:Cofactor assembly of complex C subunit B
MNNVLISTFILTILLTIGLFFFIKASTKDRIEQMLLESSESESELLPRLQQYFTDRAYRVAAVDNDTEVVTFEGMVSPSVFLTILLTGLAAIGALCLSLVLSMLFPQIGQLFLGLIAIAPVAGWFYWQGSARTEQVKLKVEEVPADLPAATLIKISGHRDELAVFQSALQLSVREEIK